MAEFDIIGAPDEFFVEWLLDASAERGLTEVRVRTPWGPKLVKINDYRLLQETAPGDKEFTFTGTLGRFAVSGVADIEAQKGSLSVEAQEAEEPELLTLLDDDAPLTPMEWMFGWDTEG